MRGSQGDCAEERQKEVGWCGRVQSVGWVWRLAGWVGWSVVVGCGLAVRLAVCLAGQLAGRSERRHDESMSDRERSQLEKYNHIKDVGLPEVKCT